MMKKFNKISLLPFIRNTIKNFSSTLSGSQNPEYTKQMFEIWSKDPTAVHEAWNNYFINYSQGSSSMALSQNENVLEVHRVINLIRTYQKLGYINGKTNPLNVPNEYKSQAMVNLENDKVKLTYEYHGFNESDLDKEYTIFTENLDGLLSEQKPIKLRKIVDRLNDAYCGSIGAEFSHVISRDECNFLRSKFENEWINYNPSKERKLHIYDQVAWSVLFEEFLQNKFTTAKRFGLEGMESFVSGLKAFVRRSGELGVKDFTIGMAHRGRLNVLSNVLRKPNSQILGEFQGNYILEGKQVTGDVKYHLGCHRKRTYEDGLSIDIELLSNPSHLETINPVCQGMTYASQIANNDVNKDHSIAIIVHGDAAFAGQGINYEAMQMNDLRSFDTGGDLHVICNNQVGFTTNQRDARTGVHCTDLAKAFDLPIIHVNAEDPIAVEFSFTVAAEYRKKFKKSIFINVIGYRKLGHNELDQPLFTQPLLYKNIQKKQTILQVYEKQLLENGSATQKEVDSIKSKINMILEEDYKSSKSVIEFPTSYSSRWEEFFKLSDQKDFTTGLPVDKIRELGLKLTTLPSDVEVNNQIKKIYDVRHKTIKEGTDIDWATAESLAFGSLIQEGYSVRISGQDVERGTFSHRHAVIHDQSADKKYIPLSHIGTKPNQFQAGNSHLSEYAVLGFETGYSYFDPKSLCIWEAQFGDFANEASIIVDQFISCQESKWNFQSGLIMLLPHGMDGQGAEHSSCRVERYLAMMDDDSRVIPDINISNNRIQKSNMQVCNPSTSANYFHLLRRQLLRKFRKALIVPSPKKLLRYKGAGSEIKDFSKDKFEKCIGETDKTIAANPLKVKTILACSGQVYYDLLNERTKLKRNDVAIVRLEQVGPFPFKEFVEQIKPYSNANLVWAQEEHMNYGPWAYVYPRINNLMKKYPILKNFKKLTYVGRNPSSAPATGHHGTHEKELRKLLNDAFTQ